MKDGEGKKGLSRKGEYCCLKVWRKCKALPELECKYHKLGRCLDETTEGLCAA